MRPSCRLQKQPASRRENIPEITSYRLILWDQSDRSRTESLRPTCALGQRDDRDEHAPQPLTGQPRLSNQSERHSPGGWRVRHSPETSARPSQRRTLDRFATPSMLSIDTGHTQMSRTLNQGTTRQKHRNSDRNNEPDSTPEPAGHHTSDSGVMVQVYRMLSTVTGQNLQKLQMDGGNCPSLDSAGGLWRTAGMSARASKSHKGSGSPTVPVRTSDNGVESLLSSSAGGVRFPHAAFRRRRASSAVTCLWHG